MKILKSVLKLTIALAILTTYSCKKEGQQGEKGEQGIAGQPGPQARTFNFNLTFNPGDTYKSYTGITGVDADDVMLFYMYYESISSTPFWTNIPVIIGNINYIPEFSDQSNIVFINTKKADGTSGSPWSSSITLGFKVVLIKSSQKLAYPNIDFSNYYEVKGAFNLPN